tara:strand:+ start:166 stop:591 length:426 start_codon:yes stop_codon:yes gene_type:complete
MKKSILILLIGATLVSCECGKNKNREAKLYSTDDITVTYNNGISKGRQAMKDSLEKRKAAEKQKEQPPTPTVSAYSAENFNLPTGKVVKYSPSAAYIDDMSPDNEVDFDIYIHIEDEDGMRTVHLTDYKTWLTLKVGSILK